MKPETKQRSSHFLFRSIIRGATKPFLYESAIPKLIGSPDKNVRGLFGRSRFNTLSFNYRDLGAQYTAPLHTKQTEFAPADRNDKSLAQVLSQTSTNTLNNMAIGPEKCTRPISHRKRSMNPADSNEDYTQLFDDKTSPTNTTAVLPLPHQINADGSTTTGCEHTLAAVRKNGKTVEPLAIMHQQVIKTAAAEGNRVDLNPRPRPAQADSLQVFADNFINGSAAVESVVPNYSRGDTTTSQQENVRTPAVESNSPTHEIMASKMNDLVEKLVRDSVAGEQYSALAHRLKDRYPSANQDDSPAALSPATPIVGKEVLPSKPPINLPVTPSNSEHQATQHEMHRLQRVVTELQQQIDAMKQAQRATRMMANSRPVVHERHKKQTSSSALSENHSSAFWERSHLTHTLWRAPR